MSKIEEALKRVRQGQAGGALPAPLHVVPGRELARTAAHSENLPATIEQRQSSSLAIARMRETSLLSREQLEHNLFIHPEFMDDAVVQAFRQIRTQVIQQSLGRNCVIMVTSVVGHGGSSFVARNLAAAFAFDAGKTALLIDCNLRHPTVEKLLEGGTHLGLADYLEDAKMDVAQIIYPVGIERLRVIPTGGRREIAIEYFTSAKMRNFLDDLRGRYQERFIIFDAPPMTESADTRILAELCDYMLLVVPYGKVTDARIQESIKKIDTKKLLGVVFNNEPQLPRIQWLQSLRKAFGGR